MRKNLPLSFRSGISLGEANCRVVAQIDELINLGSVDTEIYEWSAAKGWSGYTLNWLATRITPNPFGNRGAYIGGLDGFVCVEDNSYLSLEKINLELNGLKVYGDLRDFRLIGEHIYATGMSRQVYRRESTNQWIRLDAGTLQKPGDFAIVGFNSIDGLNENDIYAAGFAGEIWNLHRGVWRQIHSPTNLVLHRIRVVAPDKVYACGQEGMLVRCFNGKECEVIEHDCTDANLWGMEWFAGHLYLASDHKLFVLENDCIKPMELGFGEFTFGDLHASNGALWSFGIKHLAWTTDGVNWYDATPSF